MHFIDPFLYHNVLLFPIMCCISYGRKITCVGVICILHGRWIISGAPSNSSFILEPKNQSKIANQVSWFRRIFWNGSWAWNHQTKTISAFQKSSTLPIQFQHCGFSVISFILIKYFQSSLFYWVSTAGNYIWFCKRHSNSDVRIVDTRDPWTVMRFCPWIPGIDGLEQ